MDQKNWKSYRQLFFNGELLRGFNVFSQEDILCTVSQIYLNKGPILIFRVSGRTRILHFGKSCPRISMHSLNGETSLCESIDKNLTPVWSKRILLNWFDYFGKLFSVITKADHICTL